eukprot:CAMPEP_0179479370 /NCGR_PEP_ID=MMETSP0799-20121207/57604_1 /TAXON_ID=46947 /ORGANISM="Geminigera cryophila, Strain CCMP2564" /LENGTH=76 /DNA_ID=CAMNT_0021290921 /DNA_START=272 /DNA_END=502 /DNA_ORIENTATION=+
MREKAFESYSKGKWFTILAASSTLNASSTEMFFSATKNLTTVTKKKLTQGFRMDVPKSDNSKELIMTVFGGKFITT